MGRTRSGRLASVLGGDGVRLIDADALIEDIKTKLWDWDTVDGITSSTVLKQTITDIGNAPTIDAVPVVRCKGCKWFGKTGCAIEIVDETDMPKENDFCSFGERKDHE